MGPMCQCNRRVRCHANDAALRKRTRTLPCDTADLHPNRLLEILRLALQPGLPVKTFQWPAGGRVGGRRRRRRLTPKLCQICFAVWWWGKGHSSSDSRLSDQFLSRVSEREHSCTVWPRTMTTIGKLRASVRACIWAQPATGWPRHGAPWRASEELMRGSANNMNLRQRQEHALGTVMKCKLTPR
jgi:hypothetical protein